MGHKTDTNFKPSLYSTQPNSKQSNDCMINGKKKTNQSFGRQLTPTRQLAMLCWMPP